MSTVVSNTKKSAVRPPELPLQPVSADTFLQKYAKGSEPDVLEVQKRVARALSVNETDPAKHEEHFLWALRHGFIPGGRVNSAAGLEINATLINCFVQPVGDSWTETVGGKVGIGIAQIQAGETMRRGGGVGYDFSSLRPNGARVKGTRSRASGPLSFMDIFDAMCKTVESAGARRGAQMGVLRCDHPDIEAFIRAKKVPGVLTNFNVSIAVTDAFMHAVQNGGSFELVHKAEPADDLKKAGAYQRRDGLWVYRTINASELWDEIIRTTYDYAEPGVIFIDQVNRENNLRYVEKIEACNPCGEQFLPDYGCCCLGSVNITRMVRNAFTPQAFFDEEEFSKVVRVAVRMLDNVLDVTVWPLPEQDAESKRKRRIGLGLTGLGNALTMLGLRYDSAEGRAMAGRITEVLRNESYLTSVDLAKERGAFPLFDADEYLQSGFAQRLPSPIREAIRRHGLRNSHLLSIAPTGTISLTFGNNCSGGVEPSFSFQFLRKRRMPDGSIREDVVKDYAYLLYEHQFGETRVDALPSAFVSAQQISVMDHVYMTAEVAKYIDSAISKTVNVPEDYPFTDFQTVYMEAWKLGLKGITTYRPSPVRGAVLSTIPDKKPQDAEADPKRNPESLDTSDPDRRIVLTDVPTPPMASLRWPSRPSLRQGNPAWTYMIDHPNGAHFALFVGHVENGKAHPFEIWVNGAEQPRGLGALAKLLSKDMRADDRAWLKMKLDSLAKAVDDTAFTMDAPWAENVRFPSLVSAVAQLVRYRCEQLDAFSQTGDTPVLNAMFARKEPKTTADGTLSWTADISNPATGDDFVLGLKELNLPNGQRRPYSIWLSGGYPRQLDGLCKALSLDMRVIDPAWIGKALRSLVDFPEPQGDFFAPVPGSNKQQVYPSTIAYIARLVIHRYAMLGLLDEEGYPVEDMGVMEKPANVVSLTRPAHMSVMAGKQCKSCHAMAVIRKDGCDFCTACGEVGSCG
jgi:ribonucleoside-diphosphate reductase alpha chain